MMRNQINMFDPHGVPSVLAARGTKVSACIYLATRGVAKKIAITWVKERAEKGFAERQICFVQFRAAFGAFRSGSRETNFANARWFVYHRLRNLTAVVLRRHFGLRNTCAAAIAISSPHTRRRAA